MGKKLSPAKLTELIKSIDKVISYFDPERVEDRDGIEQWRALRKDVHALLQRTERAQARKDHSDK